MYSGSITDIKGLLVGHAQDTAGMTGISVVLVPEGAVCGVDVRGSAPGTRETDFKMCIRDRFIPFTSGRT